MTLLTIDHLEKHYGGVHAVAGVSFSVASGERVALIGPNGAGKTTCFNMIGGQIRPDAGRVLLGGEDITGAPPRALFRKGVGRTFQIATTFGSMTVRENVQLALLSHARRALRFLGEATDAAAEEARALLAAVGLETQATRPCDQLAYGDVKRLELAMALANAPRLLLMDEPTAGMAPRERHELMALVSDISAQRDLSVLFTEHDMDVVFGHADRIVVLDRGRLVAQGSQEEVRVDPEVKRIYLGESA
ncbi:MAG: ABC transporter ATP-binding protein [Burkholderiales bacterium]|nr:ABC transporter ATP-binding protein [Burkholderiales bacterium]